MQSYKVLAALLTYPTAELVAALPELRAALAGEDLLRGDELRALGPLLERLEGEDLYDARERYVALFDHQRALAPYLFEHVYGDSKARGQAMVDLAALYDEAGVTIAAHELPDYLPLFLEFLSLVSPSRAAELLGNVTHVTGALADRLAERGSDYAAVLRPLERLGGGRREAAEVVSTDRATDRDLEALDDEWEDKPVEFGPGSCEVQRPAGGTTVVVQRVERPAADRR